LDHSPWLGLDGKPNTRQGLSSKNKEERGTIADRAGPINAIEATGLFLLFHAGNRPDVSALRKAIAGVDGLSISHDPSSNADAGDEITNWVEVVMDGLSFDITGLAPEKPIAAPEFTWPNGAGDLSAISEAHVVIIAPGPHLTGGAYLLPILRGLLSLGARLGERMTGLLAYGWPPSKGLIDPALFNASADGWAKGGPFPASTLIRFKDAVDMGLQSEGLAVFTGQELRLEPDLVEDKNMALRLGMRLVDQLVLRGRIEQVEELTGPDGNKLCLEPSRNGKFVRVWRG
jgi:hypothetical protein